MIEQRTFLIAKIILENDGTITIGEIAEKLNVSAKTVSRQLPKVEELFNNYNLKLDKRTGAGLKVLGSAVKKFAMLELGKNAIYKKEYSPKERLSVITSTLLLSREPIKLFALSSSLQVTDSTISMDLDKLEPWFQERGLRLLRKPGLGISLLGSERDFRRAIVKYIYEHIGESELLNLAQYNLNVKIDEQMAQTSNFLLNLIDEDVWNKLDKEIHTLESELGYQFSDNAFIGLIVHISLTIERIKNNETIKIDDEIIKSIQNKREYSAVSKLTNKLEQLFGIKIPEMTSSGKILRLKNLGLPKKSGGYGNLNAKIKIIIPQNLTKEQIELYKKLAK